MGLLISLKEAIMRVREAKTLADIEALFRDAFGDEVFDVDEGQEAATIKASLGIKKGYPVPLTEAVKGANPRFILGGGYNHNCQRCIAVFELRRRGFSVIALPKTRAADVDKIYSSRDCFKNPDIIGRRKGPEARPIMRDELISRLMELPDGARASICWTREKGGGHTIVCEKANGRLVFADPQTGHVGIQVLGEANRNGYSYFRMDNLEFDETKLTLIAEKEQK